MKKIIILLTTLILAACAAPEDTVPTEAINDSITDIVGASTIAEGELAGRNGYTSVGDIEILFNAPTNTYSLLMNDFRNSNGPSLKVYLSEASTPRNILNLGSLRSTNGNIRYDFDAFDFNPDFTHLLIWCDEFGVGFGEASLQIL